MKSALLLWSVFMASCSIEVTTKEASEQVKFVSECIVVAANLEAARAKEKVYLFTEEYGTSDEKSAMASIRKTNFETISSAEIDRRVCEDYLAKNGDGGLTSVKYWYPDA